MREIDVDANSNSSAHGNTNGISNDYSTLICSNGIWNIDTFHYNEIFFLCGSYASYDLGKGEFDAVHPRFMAIGITMAIPIPAVMIVQIIIAM